MKKSIIPEKGAKPIGPYSPGIQAENMLFVSGQTGKYSVPFFKILLGYIKSRNVIASLDRKSVV